MDERARKPVEVENVHVVSKRGNQDQGLSNKLSVEGVCPAELPELVLSEKINEVDHILDHRLHSAQEERETLCQVEGKFQFVFSH